MNEIEEISEKNFQEIAKQAYILWPDSSLEHEIKDFERILKSDIETAFLARSNDQPIGFAYAKLRSDWVEGTSTSPVCYLEGIQVNPELRKSGIAKALVDHVIQWSLAQGCTEMGSDVEIDNATSIAFHESIGFKEANRVVCYAMKIP